MAQMLLRSLTEPLTAIKGVGPALAAKFARLGITNISGLLAHYPRRWEDRSAQVPLSDFHKATVCTEVTALACEWIGGPGGRFSAKKTPKIYVEDESARAALICFNRPRLADQLKAGARCHVYGKFQYNSRFSEIQSTSFEVSLSRDDNKTAYGIFPVYPLCAGLEQWMTQRFIGSAVEEYAQRLEDELPAEIRERDGLLSKAAAIKAIHLPLSFEELENARKTLMYEELFYLSMAVCRRSAARKHFKRNALDGKEAVPFTPLQKHLLERLPFALTPGQSGAIAEINADMRHSRAGFAMSRLLQGDVGSGKTLVSFFAALRVVDEGAQAAIMAPTELLARQHAQSAAQLLEPLGARIAFLTGNVKSAGRKTLLRHLGAGEIDIVVGTHALFSRDVQYKNLKLVVVDEQHRFGVMQRSQIMGKSLNSTGAGAHLLMMSATPIPRTLELTLFGDMEVSIIRDMPPGRKPVKTHLARESLSEGRVYDFVRRKLEAGAQAYFVYPFIENDLTQDGGDLSLKDVVSMAQRLETKIFPGFSVALVHSRLSEEEKRKTMDLFRKGEIKILVATSVVEVGVDVPNASCMVIERAERFGLSALHQLR
ncbi:MAG: ATP-dependent DNA helicase RecG, partial [Treponema sp.]|nr:ATP-dependent DNA helicase RecG [Treponema sp.]